MLRWTAAGAVSSPTTVQVRVQRAWPGRVQAGAPAPTRSLSPAELAANLRHFTAGMRTPRTRPCTSLVLSGQGVLTRPDLPAALALARVEGIDRIVLHAGPEDLQSLEPGAWVGRLDGLVLPLRAGAELALAEHALAAAIAAGLPVATNTVLDAATLPHLAAITQLLLRRGSGAHTFTYPFPTGPQAVDSAPPPLSAVAALAPAVAELEAAGRPVGIKGLPACYLGPLARCLRRTGNRWYVDADHQLDLALLFFPDVVAFFKGDACRFCGLADRCDGFFSSYLARPGTPPLEPVDPLSEPPPAGPRAAGR